MKFIVMELHRSEFPDPITFTEGTSLQVGEAYQGDEGWEHWYFCETAGQRGGWVPAQVIQMLAPGQGVAREDYTARELDVEVGERLLGGRQLNGWVWCGRDGESGWVPLRILLACGY
ncbi:SH3 domain-containing protein [Pseudomonas huaxiensis]|uniref:SH3 domain-containing protein n=1 Tax=Pseudomonas huaxiensis TaxID=2213017 RepID=UPI001CDC59FA|nr:SH3 domain-containing protein [Pseudomonas huaxiensis]